MNARRSQRRYRGLRCEPLEDRRLLTIYSADMDTLPAWTLDSGTAPYQWQWGTPAGGGSHNGDPTSGYTGANVVHAVDTGVVLTMDNGGGHTGTGNAFDVLRGPSGVRLFAVPDDGSSDIVELDRATGTEINRFVAPDSTSGGAVGLAFDGTSLFFIGSGMPATLYELDPDSGGVLDADMITTGSGAFDGLGALNGKIYVLDYSASDILEFDPVADVVTNILDIDGVNPGTDLVGGLAGITGPDALIATDSSGEVVEIDPNTGSVTNAFTPPAGSYWGVAAIGGEIYLGTGTGGSQIDVVTRTGVFQRTLWLPYDVSALGGDDLGGGPVPGDVNRDGEVNHLDVEPFMDVLLNGPYDPIADMNQDGRVNGLDINPFYSAVASSGATAAGAAQESVPDEDLAVGLGEADVTSTALPGPTSTERLKSLGSQLPRGRRFWIDDQESLPHQSDHLLAAEERLGRPHQRARQIHISRAGDEHPRLLRQAAVERVFAGQLRVAGRQSRDERRSAPEDGFHQVQRKPIGDWLAAVDRAMESNTGWIR